MRRWPLWRVTGPGARGGAVGLTGKQVRNIVSEISDEARKLPKLAVYDRGPRARGRQYGAGAVICHGAAPRARASVALVARDLPRARGQAEKQAVGRPEKLPQNGAITDLPRARGQAELLAARPMLPVASSPPRAGAGGASYHE